MAKRTQIEDPKRQFEQCQSQCSSRYGEHQREQRQFCQQQCREKYEQQRKQQEQTEQSRERGEGNKNREEEEKEDNPYFFEKRRFQIRFRTEEGHFKVLERFSQRSEFLKGIDNYRLAVLEANPNTFLLPHHCDAEAVFVVTNGQGTITFVHHQQRESFNLRFGDAIKVPAGTTTYLINSDNNEKLRILMLVHPINTPGHFEEYFGAGGQDPESFYRVFSNEVLEAALNTPRDRLERVFGQQRKGVIVRASQEQIRALSQQAEGSSAQRERGESRRGPFNLLQQEPLFSNQFGQFFEASPNNFEQLRDLDASVAFMNIKQGAMIAPYFNSRSTKLVLVVRGNGHFEMACPHLARQSQGSKGKREQEQEQEQETRGVRYQKVRARFSPGDVFIIPADHPITIIASGNENLQLVGVGINAHNNHKTFLAGRNNVWNQIESEAKELSFRVPAREVDEVFRRQEQSYFVPGPRQIEQREEGRGNPMSSILDFAGFL